MKRTLDIQERLLLSAERLFARHGFDRTSVWPITNQADCNVVGVNYYFGGQEAVVSPRGALCRSWIQRWHSRVFIA